MDRILFGRIFQDAQVFDVDFSQWSRHIRFYVIGVDAIFPLPSRLPLFVVEFQHVSSFAVRFRHLGVQLDDPGIHFQWGIHDFSVVEEDDLLKIELVGSGSSPNLDIECLDVKTWRISNEKVGDLFPDWSRPGAPFARPGIEEMLTLRYSARAGTGEEE